MKTKAFALIIIVLLVLGAVAGTLVTLTSPMQREGIFATLPGGLMGVGEIGVDSSAVSPSVPRPIPAPAPSSAAAPAIVARGPSLPPAATALEFIGRKIILNGNLAMEVEEVPKALEEIRSIAIGLEGYMAQMSSSLKGADGKGRFGSITVRVPQQSFFTALERIENVGKVTSKQLNSQDVTEQFIDLQTRLKNAQNAEQRLVAILLKAEKVGEILEVERELSRVRGQIEQLQGQLQYLERRVELATITVNLTEVSSKPQLPSELNPLITAVAIALTLLIIIAQGLVVLTIVGGPFVVVGASLYHVYRRRKRRAHGG